MKVISIQCNSQLLSLTNKLTNIKIKLTGNTVR